MTINPTELKAGSTFTVKETHPLYHTVETQTYTVKKRTSAGNFKVQSADGWGCTIRPSYFTSPVVEVLEVAI